jgi:hypothetical protein
MATFVEWDIDLRLLFNLPHVEVTDFSTTDKEVYIHFKSLFDGGYCPFVSIKNKLPNDVPRALVYYMSLLGSTVYLHFETRQFHCQDPHRYFNERIDRSAHHFVEPAKNLTTRYETYLYKTSENIYISDASVKELET